MRTLITQATMLPMTGEGIVLKGDIAIDGTRIVAVGDVPSQFTPEKIIHANGMIAMPSLINAHTHASMTYFRNYRDSVSNLHDWLQQIWKLEDLLTAEDIYPASLLAMAEMIASGTTCFSDMYFFPDRTAQAAADAKVKANIGLTLFGDLQESNRRYDQILPKIKTITERSSGRLTYDIAPHAVYTCSEETFAYAVSIAEQEGCRVHTHASESLFEVTTSKERTGASPIGFLDRFGYPTQGSYYAHCVHPIDRDIHILKEHGVSVVHNPSSNSKLGNGISPISEYLVQGINVALGTDGASSNNSLDMFQEIRLAAMLSSASAKVASQIKPYAFLEMATIGGARALGRAHLCGTLEVGKSADIILLRLDEPHMIPLNDVFSAVVFSAKSSDVDTVLCDGEILMEQRRLLTIDIEQLTKEIQSRWNHIQRQARERGLQ